MHLTSVICLACVLVAVSECQDMTSMIFQALGMDPPMLPPVMPQSMREQFYPRQWQQEILRQKQLQQQKQRYLNYLSAQQQRQMKANPYSAQYRTSSKSQQPRENSVFSPANMIRQPGAANSAASFKGNPYSTAYQNVSIKKGGSRANPYSVSRAASSGVPAIRGSASMAPVPISQQAAKMLKTMQTMKIMREQPRRITDAKAAGCTLPIDSAAASVMLFNDCRNPAARMVCQAEMLTCMNVGMAAMCCPYGMNRLAMDTISYVNKLQQFVSEMA